MLLYLYLGLGKWADNRRIYFGYYYCDKDIILLCTNPKFPNNIDIYQNNYIDNIKYEYV